MIKENATIWFYLLVAGLIFLAASIWIMVDENISKFISPVKFESSSDRFWEVQTIDAMKYSRDVAREKLNDYSYDREIETQVSEIAKTGATHIGIGVPYDDEFIPFLKRWVVIARKHNIKVWFRGNMSGWEGWFGYKKIDRVEHSRLIAEFIKKNQYLFEDGDIFTSCPECENGGPGDPRYNNDAKGHAEFLIYENELSKRLFKEMGKNVKTNYYSMNGDVARLLMNKETTKMLDGVITIDHYVKTPEQLTRDVQNYAKTGNGKVVLGEWGAPIPDIHGEFTEQEQADWIDESFKQIITEPSIIGINYWVNKGGSTAIWNEDNSRREAVAVITKYFNPTLVKGTITDEFGTMLNDVRIQTKYKSVIANGEYAVPVIKQDTVIFTKSGHTQMQISVDASKSEITRNIVLAKTHRTLKEQIELKIRKTIERMKATVGAMVE